MLKDNKAVFTVQRTVVAKEIDELNHVNNVVYIQWIQEVASLHWFDLIKENPQENCIWVVARHEIDYIKSAVLGDVITLKTWVGETEGVKSIRYVEILKNDILITKAKTIWCLLDTKTKRAKRISESVLNTLFSNAKS